MKDGDQFGIIVSVFSGCYIVGDPYLNNVKGRAYSYKRVLGAWDDHQTIQASDGSDSDRFGQSDYINEKNVVIRAPYRDNGNGPNEGAVYVFTLMEETWTDDKTITASDVASGDKFGSSVTIRVDTLLVRASYKDGYMGAAYVFVLAGDGSLDKGTKLVPRNGIASRYCQ